MKRKAKRVDREKVSSLLLPRKTCAHFSDGLGSSVPPDFEIVQIYFDQKEMAKLASQFFIEQEKADWKYRFGKPIRNWKEVANEWIFDREQEIKLQLKRSVFYSPSSW